jgi:DNA polymerase III epsilon subunit-like protein
MSKIVVDLETGGLDPAIHAILSIGAIALDDNLSEVGRMYTLVKDFRKAVTREALKINGISMLSVDKHGVEIAQALDFLLALAGDVPVWVFHNASFDAAFLNERDMGIKHAVCTLETSRELYLDQSYRHTLPIACEREGIRVARAHHAMGDVAMTANLWRAYYKKDPGKAGLLRDV